MVCIKPACGVEHDRDINAAINICNEGKRITTVGTTGSNDFGEGVQRTLCKTTSALEVVAQSSLN